MLGVHAPENEESYLVEQVLKNSEMQRTNP